MLLENKIALIYGAGGAVGQPWPGPLLQREQRSGGAGIAATGGVADTAQVDALDEEAIEWHVDAVMQKAGDIDILFDAIGM